MVQVRFTVLQFLLRQLQEYNDGDYGVGCSRCCYMSEVRRENATRWAESALRRRRRRRGRRESSRGKSRRSHPLYHHTHKTQAELSFSSSIARRACLQHLLSLILPRNIIVSCIACISTLSLSRPAFQQ